MTVELIEGDCREVLREFEANSIDAVVTDPPYGLNFMGKHWDYDVPDVGIWREVFRVLKPGGHLLSFGGSRTYHRMAVAIEDAGFEIRDQVMWLYGSGFPKSSNQDGDWEGWGTALKPAHEPIVMARKPLIGTMGKNLTAHGVGALNIDRCRVELSEGDDPRLGGKGDWSSDKMAKNVYEGGYAGVRVGSSPLGRWPANIIHDGSDEVLAAFPQARGQIADASTSSSSRKTQNVYGDMKRGNGREGEPSADDPNDGTVGFKMRPGARRNDGGSAARFFYCAKASKADRDDGLATFDKKNAADAEFRPNHMEKSLAGEDGNPFGRWQPRKNNHPTVKPTDLMRYLCRLVTPPGGTILDPFMGSGSTGRGAVLEGFSFVGIEMMPEYFEFADARIAAAEAEVTPKMQAAE